MTKSGDAWARLFEHFEIAEHVALEGYFDIQAHHFKRFHLEPRLLTKIDHSHQLPPVMKSKGLAILTLTNSTWRVGPFNIFAKLPEWKVPDSTVVHKTLPGWLESLNGKGITGEGALINAAEASGIFQDFVGEDLVATVSGKGRSGSFDFTVSNTTAGSSKIEVRGAQIEIDAGFEGPSALYLVEAKKHLSLDFNVRQLYYPYRTWSGKVSKPVRTVFITLANDVFDLTEFSFANEMDFSSIQMVSTKRFMLTPDLVTRRQIVQIAEEIERNPPISPIRDTSFPQADDFERMIDLLEFVATRPRSREDIALNYEFHDRQADYYFSALRYLGLGEKVRGSDGLTYRVLTKVGAEIAALPFAKKRLALAKRLLEVSALREMFLSAVRSGRIHSVEDAEKLVAIAGKVEGFDGSTIHRRAQTALAWVRWLLAFNG